VDVQVEEDDEYFVGIDDGKRLVSCKGV